MVENFGSLLYYVKKKKHDDLFTGYKVVVRLATNPNDETREFIIPSDKLAVKLDKCTFLVSMTIPENYVPDNGFAAKMVQKFGFNILDNEIFSAYTDGLEYPLLNFFIKKLNFSPKAQEIEMFPEGHYDAYDCDGGELLTRLVKSNGKNLVENRQQYAVEKWITQVEDIKIGQNQDAVPYDRLEHTYTSRSHISHGLARQKRVIPPNSKVSFEVELADAKSYLMKTSDYQKCRTLLKNCFEKKADGQMERKQFFPYNSTSIEMIDDVRIHEFKAECDCVTSAEDAAAMTTKFDTEEYTGWEQLRYAGQEKVKTDEKTKVFGKGANFKAHKVFCKTPRFETYTDEDDVDYIIFYAKVSEETSTKRMSSREIVDKMQIETHFVNPKSDEKPLTTGVKGVCKIPFYYPRLQTQACLPGRIQYSVTVSTGPLPEMILLTGMPHSRRKYPSFDLCRTKFTMLGENFKIKEFEIFVDNNYEFGTPWKSPRDHYINFLKHNGRFENKAIGEGVDFFQFINENWFVPMSFSDRAGQNATVEVRITFEEPIQYQKESNKEEEPWDVFYMRMPVDDLILDANRGRKSSKYVILFN